MTMWTCVFICVYMCVCIYIRYGLMVNAPTATAAWAGLDIGYLCRRL